MMIVTIIVHVGSSDEVERLEMAIDWKMNWLRDCPAVHFVVSKKACTSSAGTSLVGFLRS